VIQQTLHYGDLRIPYSVLTSSTSGRKLAIQIGADGVIKVRASSEVSLATIKQAVTKRARWLHNHLTRVNAQNSHALPREYVSGETHFYLGRRYLLKVKKSSREVPSVKLKRGRLEVITDADSRDRIRALLWTWYRDRALAVFDRRLIEVCEPLPWINSLPKWKLLTMKKQWGSCSPAGVLSINPHLVKASSLAIDYVLLHELCHLRVHNHSHKFYRLLDRQMPGWKEVKTRLDGMAGLLLNR
jgi:predicted metal-dependent hydrolase